MAAPKEGVQRKPTTHGGEEAGCLKNAHRGSCIRRTRGGSYLKPELASRESLTLVAFGAQVPVAITVRRAKREKSLTHSEGLE